MLKRLLLMLCFSLAAVAQTTTLSAGLSATSKDLNLTAVTGIAPSQMLLVENEAVSVCSVNAARKLVRICAWGRGMAGTTAATHANGAAVILNPVMKIDSAGKMAPGALPNTVVQKDGSGNVTIGAGAFTADIFQLGTPVHVAALPACAAPLLGQRRLVDDADSKTPGAAVVGSSTYSIAVQCVFNSDGAVYSWFID